MLKGLTERAQREKSIPITNTTTLVTKFAVTGNNDKKRVPKNLKRA